MTANAILPGPTDREHPSEREGAPVEVMEPTEPNALGFSQYTPALPIEFLGKGTLSEIACECRQPGDVLAREILSQRALRDP